MEKKLGKINKVKFGHVGYQECQMGLSLEFKIGTHGAVGSGVYGGFASTPSDSGDMDKTKEAHAKMVLGVAKIMSESNVDDIMDLIDLPVELTFDGNVLKDWRILTEVL